MVGLHPGTSNVPEWLQFIAATAPLATLLAALIAATIAVATLRQRNQADKRDQWWKRAQWAMDLAINGDLPTKSVGIQALKQLEKSKLIGREEEAFLFEVLGSVQDLVLDRVQQEAQTGWTRRFRRDNGPRAK